MNIIQALLWVDWHTVDLKLLGMQRADCRVLVKFVHDLRARLRAGGTVSLGELRDFCAQANRVRDSVSFGQNLDRLAQYAAYTEADLLADECVTE